MGIIVIFIDLEISSLSLLYSIFTYFKQTWSLRLASNQSTGRLRFCLCIVLFITNRKVSFSESSYWLINSQPVPGVQIVESAALHYYISKPETNSLTLVLFYHSHRFQQRLASVFTTHHSSLTNKTPWEHFQHLLILMVRFLVPQPLPSQFPAFPITDVTKPIGD